MIDRRSTIALTAALGALVVLLILGIATDPGRMNSVALLRAIDPREIDSIAITSPNGSVLLLRSSEDGGGPHWWVAEGRDRYPGNGSNISALVRSLAELRSYGVVTSNPAEWSRFGVDPRAETTVTVSARAGIPESIGIGMVDASGVEGFLRLNGDPRVFLTASRLHELVLRGESFWCDLKLLPPDLGPDQVTEIGIHSTGLSIGGVSLTEDYILDRGSSNGVPTWAVQGRPSVRIDNRKVLSLVAELLTIEGERLEPAGRRIEGGTTSPGATVTVADDRGRMWAIQVGRREGESFLVGRSDESYVYVVNQWAIARTVVALSALVVSGADPTARF